jgi:hypothetical protein
MLHCPKTSSRLGGILVEFLPVSNFFRRSMSSVPLESTHRLKISEILEIWTSCGARKAGQEKKKESLLVGSHSRPFPWLQRSLFRATSVYPSLNQISTCPNPSLLPSCSPNLIYRALLPSS